MLRYKSPLHKRMFRNKTLKLVFTINRLKRAKSEIACESLADQSDHSTGDSSTCIACRFAQLVTAESKVILIRMHDQSATHDGRRSAQRYLLVRYVHFGNAIRPGDHIAQIAGMTFRSGRSSMSFAGRIEMGTGRNASVAGVTELVHMKSMLSRCQTANFTGDLKFVALFLSY